MYLSPRPSEGFRVRVVFLSSRGLFARIPWRSRFSEPQKTKKAN